MEHIKKLSKTMHCSCGQSCGPEDDQNAFKLTHLFHGFYTSSNEFSNNN